MQRLGLAHTPKTESRLKELLWPDVDNEVAIRTVCHTGMWVSLIVGGMTVLFSTFAGALAGGLLIAVVFIVIGIGIRKCSRIAALLAVVLYVGAQLLSGSLSVVSFIFAFLFISSARATFAFHRLKKRRSLAEKASEVISVI